MTEKELIAEMQKRVDAIRELTAVHGPDWKSKEDYELEFFELQIKLAKMRMEKESK